MSRNQSSKKSTTRLSKKRPDKPNFEVEQMEQRLLLTANLYDPADPTPPTGTNSVQQKLSAQLSETFNQMGLLGDSLNTEFNGKFADTVVPLLDKTLDDYIGTDIGDFFKFAAGHQGIQDTLNGDTPDSQKLALSIETALSDFGLSGTVVDESSDYGLNLKINIADGEIDEATDIHLGSAEEELNLRIEDGTTVNVDSSRDLSFRILADLTSIQTGADTDAKRDGLTDNKFWIDLFGDEGLSISANALHTSTTDQLTEFGVQVGLLGMRETGGDAGAYALAGSQFILDVTGEFSFNDVNSDERLDLAELKGFQASNTWSSAHDFSTPTIGDQNSASVIMQVGVANNAAATTHIGGIDGVTGTVTFTDQNLFDESAPMATTDGTLAAFSRLTSQDILNMAGGVSGWASALQASGIYGDNIPFLDIASGDAYAFGRAFQEVFLAQLQNVEQVLSARNAPSTWRGPAGSLVQNPIDFSGSTEFLISINGAAWVQVTVGADPTRTTLEELAAELSAALPNGVEARVRDTNSPRLEIFADNDETQFVLTAFQAKGDGILDLGFDVLQQLVLANDQSAAFGGGITDSAQLQSTGILFEPTASVNLTDLSTTPKTLTVTINGETPVSITIPAFAYSDLDTLATKLRDLFSAAGIYNAGESSGVYVDTFTAQNGTVGLQFYGGADVHSLQFGGNAAAALNLSPTEQTSPSFDVTVTGDTTEVYRVFLPGNLTGNLLGDAANSTINDYVDDLRYAMENTAYLVAGTTLTKKSLLNDSEATGIDVRGAVSDSTGEASIQFFARNPGSQAGRINAFEIANTGLIRDLLGFTETAARGFISGDIAITPNFDSVQEFAARIADSPVNLANTGVSPSWDTNALTFTFPVGFDHTAPPLEDDAATTDVDERVAVDLDSDYGHISNLVTESRVTVERETTSSFDFQFSLKPLTRSVEELSVGIPVVVYDWDGKIENDAVFTILLDDGVEHDLTVTVDEASTNIEAADFVSQLVDALGANASLRDKITIELTTEADTGTPVITFTTVTTETDSRILQVLVRPEVASPVTTVNAAVDILGFPSGKANFTSVAAEFIADNAATNFTLSRDAIFEVTLFDGNVGQVYLAASETADNTSLADLIEDINFAIDQSAALSTLYDGTKVEAFDATGGKIGFRLNSTLFPDDSSYASENWSVEVFADYRLPSPNAASLELGIPEKSTDVAGRFVPVTALSGSLTGSDPFRLLNPAVLRLSINGSDYTAVTIPTGSLGATLGHLIADVNNALAASDVVVNGITYSLSSFVKAAMNEQGDGFAIRSLDLAGTSTPEVITMRVMAAPGANNAAVDQLGFQVEEQRAGWRGGEAYLDNIRLEGTATVTNETVTATGMFGFAEFAAADGDLNLQASSTTLLRDNTRTRFSLFELNELVSSDTMETVSATIVDPATFVTLELQDLSFTGSTVDGLAFGTGATITIEHALTGDSETSSINDFSSLPVAEITYTNTAGMENLSRLNFDDIFQGLLRSAEYISDQMRIDPDGSGAAVNPYETSLLFIKESLVGEFDFGYEFETAIAQLADAPPATLQGLQQVIADSLQLDLADVEIRLDTDYDLTSNLTEASIEISLPYIAKFATALPLFIDLAQLRNRSSDPAIVKTYLAGLDALAGTLSNPMSVDLNVLSDLNLDLGIKIVDDTGQIAPTAILHDTTTVDTSFNLAGAELSGDLPVGNARFRLTDGKVAINATGEAEVNDEFNTAKLYNENALTIGYVPPVMLTVAASTTADLGGTYTASTGTLVGSGNGALTIDGVAVSAGDRILVNNQEDNAYNAADRSWTVNETEKSQNGVYRVVSAGDASSAWSLVRDTAADSTSELNGLYVRVTGGENYANRDFFQTVQIGNAGSDTKSFAKLIDPATMSIDLNHDLVLPYAVDVATTSALDAVYAPGGEAGNPAFQATLTSRGNESLNNVTSTLANGRTVAGIDGVTDLAVGDLILVKDQLLDSVLGTNIEFQNGVYRVIDLGSVGTNGNSWVLERVDFADEVSDFNELRVTAQLGRDNGRTAFIQNNPNLSSISAGSIISFTSQLNRVYSEFNTTTLATDEVATVTPNGQAQALLPVVIVVQGEDGVERIISKDTSQLSPEQANDPDFMATQPTFDPINIRVVSEGGRSGLDRFFDLNVPSNVPGVPAPVVFFSNPDLPQDELNPFYLNIPPVDVLQVLRDPFLMGEALDLSLFNLQFAIDQALGNELPLLGLDLPSYTVFIESWRSDFTNSLRDKLRNNKLKPINATLDALYEALGPGGAGYLTSRSQIRVETLDSSESATVWDPNDSNNYDLTPANEEFEVTPSSAVSLQFALDLVKELDTDATEVNINRIYLPDELGLEVDTQTQSLDANYDAVDTTGGVNLRTAFTLHLGFGVDLTDGFYLYNPIDDGVGADESVMSIEVQAVLDGDINTAGVQAFTQGERTSTLHLLNVQIADALTVPGGVRPTDASADDQGASGIYSTYDFYLNTGSGGNDNTRTTIPDMQIRNTLGLDPTFNIPIDASNNLKYGIISFDTHGDTDIALLIEGGKSGDSFGGDGGIPDIQTEFYFQARYGRGSDRLSYVTQAVYDAAREAVANGNADEAQQRIADQPDFRVLRDLIDGAVFDFLNITVDAEEFLRGTIFEMLIKFSEGIAPIRPVLDFLLTPVPGTEWMAEPFVVGEFLGPKFLIFVRTLTNIDDTIRALGEGVGLSEGTPDWAKPRVDLIHDGFLGINTPRVIGGVARTVGIKTQYGAKSPLTLERERIQKYVINRRVDAYQKKLDRAERAFLSLQEPTEDRKASKSLREAFTDKVSTPNKFSKKFETFRDKGFAQSEGTGLKTKFVNKVKDSANQGIAGSDDRGGRRTPIANISGGGFRLDYLKIENIEKILLGKEANLSYLELPKIELGVAYSRSFPLPAFPPLQLTVGASFSIRTHLKFGWDTQGFYWSTLDLKGNPSPAFGISVGFSVGVALNFGLIEAGVQAFFNLDLDFNWNDVTIPKGTTIGNSFLGAEISGSDSSAIGYGKLRGSQIDFLKSLPGADGKMGNLFDVTLTGTVGLTFYVDLTIPIPFVGPIVKRILAKTFSIELFKVTFYAEKPGIQLGAANGGTLTLHMGEQFANLRLFGDTTARNEVFTLISHGAGSSGGEKVQIRAVLQGQTFFSDIFDNITRVIGFAGGGQSVIDASDLLYATVDFTGGSGNSNLRAGAAAGSILRGGTGTSTLTGAANATTSLYGGQGNTTIYGGTAADLIVSGARSDLLVGGGGGDTYQFLENYGRDRLFASGVGNIADFSAVTSDLTFNLGRLVQSAKEVNNTIFFAPDASGLNSIDKWIAGSGDDRFNTFYFAPDKTLEIEGGAGNNFYAITLGNQFKRFYSDIDPEADTLLDRMDPRNIGYIDIKNTSGAGTTLIKQTFPERISYDVTSVSNGREQVTMSGITRVDLDAGDATVVWGDPLKRWIDLGVGSTVTAGTVEMRSNVEADGLTLNLKRGFSITRALNLRNDSDLTITIQNADPLASANLFLGSNRDATDPWLPGIYSSSASVFSTAGVDPGLVAPSGDGTGLIRINTPTGSVFDGSDAAARAGVIQAANGEVVIEARDTVGFASNQVVINARYFAAKTTKAISTDAEGINVVSDQDLHVTLVDGVDGLNTVSGRIELTVNPGNTLYYGNITAGAGRDIIFNADSIEQSSGRTYEVLREVLTPVTVHYSFTYYVKVTYRIYWPYHSWLHAWNWYTTYTVLEPRTYSSSYEVLRLQEQLVTETVPAGGAVTTTGDVYFRNNTDNLAIRVGDSATPVDTLNITSDILNTISDSARTIIIGRNGDEAIRSGKASVLNHAFAQGLILKGSEIDILGTGAARLSSASKLEFEAYESNGANAGDGSIEFASSTNPIEAPTVFATAFRDIRVKTDLKSTEANGLVQLNAGSGASQYGAADNSGSISLDSTASIKALEPGGALILKSGLTSGNLDLDGEIKGQNSISVQARGGSILMDPGAILETNLLEAFAKTGTTLRTKVNTISNAEILGSGMASGENLTILEQDDITINLATVDAGNIIIETGGNLELGKIDATSGFDVTLDAGGSISGLDQLPEVNITARSLDALAAGSINVSTDILNVDATTTAAGSISIDNNSGLGSTLNVNSLTTADGLVLVDNEGNLIVDSIVSETSSAANSITLKTRELFGGNIVVDEIDAGALGSVRLESGSVSATGGATSGGTITSDAAGTGRITAKDLTALAGGFPEHPGTDVINLRTDIDDLIARAFTGGNPDETNSRADIVIDESNDIRLRWISTLSGDINITAAGDIVHQSVTSPNRDITLDAGGSITAQLDEALNDGVEDLAPKLRGRNLTATAQGTITANTTVDRLIVESTGTGGITITESDSALFEFIKTADGNIELTAGEFDSVANAITKGGNAILGVIQAGATGGDDVMISSYGQTRTSGQTDSAGSLLPGDTVVANAKITAGLLEVASYGRLDLLTNIDRLIADNFQIGNIEIVEDDALVISHLTSNAGSINVTTDGTLTALFVESKDDLAQAVTFDVNLHALSGDVLVDQITVGTNHNDIIITSDLGNIEEVNPQDLDDSFLSPAIGGLDLIGDNAVLSAHGSIGGIRPLETRLNSLDATSTNAGNIDLNEHDAITLTNVKTGDGKITLDAGGTITAVDVESETDNDLNDIRIHTTSGDILVDRISAGAIEGNLFLDADTGNIEEVSADDAATDLVAESATINAAHSIGGQSALETEFQTLEAHSVNSGNIDLNEIDGILLTDIDTMNGSITFDAGGTITALDVESLTDSDDNDISLHNTAGDILFDRINAGTALGDLNLRSDAGNIDELLPEDGDNDLIADHAVLNAALGIGQFQPIETEFNSLEAHSLVRGNIDLNEFDGLALDNVTTADGSIEIDANDDIVAHFVSSLTDGLLNTITLHNTAGDILLDEVLAQRNLSDVFLTSDAGGIESLTAGDTVVDLQGNNAILTAHRSIGGVETIDTELNNLTATVLAPGDINLHEASSITVDRATTDDGSITMRVENNAFIDLANTRTDSASNDIRISVGDTLHVNRILSGSNSFTGRNVAAATTVSLDADSIVEWKSDAGIDIRARDLNLSATRNIGTLSDPVETSARNIDSASGFGTNALNNYATGTVTVSNFSSTNGALFFEEFNGTITFDSISAGSGNITLFHNGTENMIINDLIAGNGDVRLTVRDAGRLQLFNTDIVGDGFFSADELDYLGANRSIKGTGTLTITTHNPANGIFVEPYSELLDRVRILEYDIVRDRADGFAFTFFKGNVLFSIPPTGATSGGERLSTSLTLDAPEGSVFLFSDLLNGSNDGTGNDASERRLRAGAFFSNAGFSPASLTGLPDAIRDLFFPGMLRTDNFESFFTAYFGYHPGGLESLLPDLFDDLYESLENNETIDEEEEDGETASLQEDTTAPQLSVSRGEAPVIEPQWETSDEAPSKAAILPLAMLSLSGRLRKHFSGKNREKGNPDKF
ncbi:MAG: hypothetical protein P1U86_07825 [Verrucomicrobiales bacterium]|nr:hypothetical protein [Verrucomicrobiales bacterium]